MSFFRYIRRDEDPVRFRRAFWNVNSFGKQLSLRLANELRIPFIAHPNKGKLNQTCVNHSPKNQHKIAFIFKGKFALAHAEFLHEFLRGSVAFIPRVKITLILVDDDSSNLRNTGIDHVEIISLPKSNTFDKLKFYYEVLKSKKFDHISWVACVQNLSLYMGHRLCRSQSYWSMKYHSIIMDSLDKYAGLGFGGKSFEFDGVQWFRGRAFR